MWIGELLGTDFETMSMMRLYRASDALMSHRRAIEDHLFEKVTGLFRLQHTVTLIDLTNTFFEGAAAKQPKAKRGHSKEKRSDCPLLTLGLVLDGSGFVRRSEVFAGNVNEDTTLEEMLSTLEASQEALVVMDAGVATSDNIIWLRDRGYRYLVVNRSLPHIVARVRWFRKLAKSSSVDPIWRPASTAPVNDWVLVAVEGVPLPSGVFVALRDGGVSDDLDPWMDTDGDICDPQPTHWTVIRLPQSAL